MRKIYFTEKQKDVLFYIILIGLIAVFTVTRIWRVSSIPSGLHLDETCMAYNSWCLSQYGVDRYLKSWPIYFINDALGYSGQSAMYTYILALLFKIFGYHKILIRVPVIFFGYITLIFGMLIVREIYPENRFRVFVTGVLITICPYFIMANRIGLDCNLMLGMATMFLYFFIKAVNSQKNGYYVTAGIAGGLMLYTYALSYIALPVFLLLSIIYVIAIKKFKIKKWILMALPMGILAAPLILVQIVNMFELDEFQIGIFTVTRLTGYRAGEIGKFSLTNMIKALKYIFVGDSVTFDSIPGTPNLYLISIFLFITGIAATIYRFVLAVIKKRAGLDNFVFLWFISVFLIGCLMDANVYRLNGIFYAVIFIITEGIYTIIYFTRKKEKVMYAWAGVIGIIYLVCFAEFFRYYYFGRYSQDWNPISYSDVLVNDGIEYIEEHPEIMNKRTYMAESKTFFALSTLKSPYEMRFDLSNGVLYDDYYICGMLGEIEEGYNYIVRDTFTEYADSLRNMGFKEIKFVNYSLFYWQDAG
jgi:4-amino-4-deoxy-L-arabinose transferase-like glycosyltransferase